MFKRSEIVKFLLALAATIASVWAAMISLPLGILVVAFCLAGAAYLQLIFPRQKAFFGGGTDVDSSDRIYVVLGVFAVTAALGVGLTAASWIQFPREMTVKEHLEQRFTRCRDLVRRPVTSEAEYADYRQVMGELIIGTRDLIRQNMEEIAVTRFDDTSGILPFSLDSDFNESHRNNRNMISRYCDNMKEVMDNYAE